MNPFMFALAGGVGSVPLGEVATSGIEIASCPSEDPWLLDDPEPIEVKTLSKPWVGRA